MDVGNSEQGPQAPEPDKSIPVKVLIVEDAMNGEMAKLVDIQIRDNDPHVSTVVTTRGDEAEQILQAQSFDLIISGIGLPGKTGLELADRARGRTKRYTLFSDNAIEYTRFKADPTRFKEETGVDNFIKKPAGGEPLKNEIVETRRIIEAEQNNPPQS